MLSKFTFYLGIVVLYLIYGPTVYAADLQPQPVQVADLAAQFSEIMNREQEIFKINETSTGDNLYVFVSFSMKDQNIKQLLEEAKRFGAILVLRGLKDNSFRKTVMHLSKFMQKEGEGMIIDPTLFKKYKVEQVPTFVLSRNCDDCSNQDYDILRGNVNIAFALEKFQDKGDLKVEAIARLKK